MKKTRVMENRLVVFKSGKGSVFRNSELTERQIESFKERIKESYAECCERRKQKQPDMTLYRTPDKF